MYLGPYVFKTKPKTKAVSASQPLEVCPHLFMLSKYNNRSYTHLTNCD